MRVFVYSLIAIPMLIVDGVLIYALPGSVSGRFTTIQAALTICGAVSYLAFHFLVHKPERSYLWAHEITHLVVAKIFLRQVHGFHITSRSGGKVVIDRTNVAIDLAPYAVPLYSLMAIGPFLLFRGRYLYSGEIYLAAAAFLFTMHLSFSFEGFLRGQPDLCRSGRIFSAATVVLCLLFWLPVLWAPGTQTGFHGISAYYREWLGAGIFALRGLAHRFI